MDKYHQPKSYKVKEKKQWAMSNKVLKARGLLHLKKGAQLDYETYEPMSHLWSQYITSLIGEGEG